jgi:hypothetical protein
MEDLFNAAGTFAQSSFGSCAREPTWTRPNTLMKFCPTCAASSPAGMRWMMSETSRLDLFPATRNVSGASFSQYSGRYRPSINKRINFMTNITIGLEKTEGEIFAFEVSDEALEIAAVAAKEKANFTLGACTGLSECPG